MKEEGFSRGGEGSCPLKQIMQGILPINIICFIQMIKSLIIWLVIFFLQICNIHALSTNSFTFDNQQSSKFRRSLFDIGKVLADTTINLQLILKVGVTDLSAARVQLIKSSDNSVINTFSCSGATCSQDFYVDSGSADTMSIRIYAPDSSSFPPNIQIYNLLARSYKGLPSDSPTAVRTLIRATDVLREEIIRVIYTSKARTLHFSLFPIPTQLSTPEEALRLFKVDPQGGWQTGYSNSIPLSDDGFTIVQPGVGADVLGLYSYSASVDVGFYAIVVTYNVGTPNMKVTWETDPYNCTFSAIYPDVNSVFTGCGVPTSTPASGGSGSESGSWQSSDGPCLVLDPSTSKCNLCTGGYFLNSNGVCTPNSLCEPGKYIKDGKCITNNPLCLKQDPASSMCLQCILGFFASIDGQCLLQLNCPDRQFFSKGSCLDVSTLCGNYSKEGLCTSCSDPSNFYLQEGKCLKKQLSCASRQFISSNNTCLNVSDSCGYYNPNSGACLSCVDDGEEAVNGTCKKIVLNCSVNEYQSGKVCLPIPAECFRFDKANKVCVECLGSFTLSGQKCVQIACADRFYYSLSSRACVQVSQLCQAYDKATGACITCKNRDYAITSSGQCVQSVNPLAGCRARQQLGYGQCISPQKNCKIYNLDARICEECDDRFEFDFAGQCSPKANCSQNEMSVNGLCLRSPENCQKVDAVGLCTKCVSKDYRIVLGQCVYFKKCESKQYLNPSGQCIDVDPLCNLFNPSNGDCITCVQSEASPHLGRCCQIGQIFNGKICQLITAQPKQSKDPSACLQYHSSLYICLKCNPGYVSDFSMKGTCVKE